MAQAYSSRLSPTSLAVGAVVLAAIVLSAGASYGLPVPAALPAASRWLAAAAVVLLAWRARSLTGWILASIVVGTVIGHEAPGVAVTLRIFSQIFLRLIRTIVAPLLFATLVVGIAGHPNLKQVGRMGVKALLYFEVVTTLALLIGWAAITVSQAGVGVSLAAPTPAAPLAASRKPGRRSCFRCSPRTSCARRPKPTCSRSWSSA
jgi:proton glutamate symport protein